MPDELSIPNPSYQGGRTGRYGRSQPKGPIRGMDPDTRRLILFAGGLGSVLLVLIGASTLMGRHSGQIPVITADARPIKERPKDPGGMKIDAAENDVFSGGSDTNNAKLAPPAETPEPSRLRAGGHAAPSAAPSAAPTAAPTAAIATGTPAAAAPAPSLVAVAPPPVKTAAAVKPQVAEPPPTAKTATGGHQTMVQLAAMTSEEAAKSEWQRLAKRMPELMNGHPPSFSKTEHDGHIFWRVRASGFADVAQAHSFCEHMRAKGGGCSVADF